MAANPDSIKGEFHPRVPPSKPLASKGHAPGTIVGPPESHVKLMPAGTAPPERTFAPASTNSNDRPEDDDALVSAEDTLVGATSKDVHKGLGHPGSGQPASQKNPHKERSGLEGRGANPDDWVKKRGLDRDHEKGGKLNSEEGRANIITAEDRLPDMGQFVSER